MGRFSSQQCHQTCILVKPLKRTCLAQQDIQIERTVSETVQHMFKLFKPVTLSSKQSILPSVVFDGA